MGCEYSVPKEEDTVAKILHTSVIKQIKLYDVLGALIGSIVLSKFTSIHPIYLFLIVLLIGMNLHKLVCKNTNPNHIRLLQDAMFIVNFIKMIF